ncbi:MAG: tetratricopeptide repeat protein [Anaerolineae bacterium]|jgi:tetratricopeptide (TPR) repeat protein|nr:tetratricopeptide repeat protein [Anaerolineae bacterium]MBT7072718.1 tetratricopeptide repeat protein [Anaerolineae bacterium]MBT7324671.1 tetratricopeptide repeat protein [Anaerolineae bacterium]
MSEHQLWNELGNIHINAGEYEQAVGAYTKAVDLNPKSGRAHKNLATAFIRLSEPEQAVSHYQRGIELFEDFNEKAAAWHNLGVAYQMLGDTKNTLLAFERAAALDPENALYQSDLELALSDISEEVLETEEEVVAAISETVESDPETEASQNVESEAESVSTAEANKSISSLATWLENTISGSVKKTDEIVEETEEEGETVAEEEAFAETLDAPPVETVEEEAPSVPPAIAKDLIPMLEENSPELDASVDELFNEISQEIALAAEALNANAEIREDQKADLAEIVENEKVSFSEIVEDEKAELLETVEDEQVELSEIDEEDTDLAEIDEEDADLAEIDEEEDADLAEAEEADTLIKHKWLSLSDQEDDDDEEEEELDDEDEEFLLEEDEFEDDIEEEVAMSEVTSVLEAVTEKINNIGNGNGNGNGHNEALQSATVWGEMGNIFFNADILDGALIAYRKALELDQNYGAVLHNLALLHMNKGEFTQAAELYQKSIPCLNDNAEQVASWNNLGNAYRAMKDYAQAEEAYRKADELDTQKITLESWTRNGLLETQKV